MSYVIKVKTIQNRSDSNYIKYWVDSYEYVAYRGLNNVLHLTDGNTDLFITDSDRGNWDIIELTSGETPIKPLDFVRDRYIWAGKGNDLLLNSNLVIYTEFDNNVRINNGMDYSVSGAALWVAGGSYFGKTVFINKTLNVANNLMASDVNSPIIVNNVSNATLNAEQTAINNKGALYIKGGVSVEQDIVANNIYLKGMIDAKNGIKFGNISSKVTVVDTTDATLVDASIITQGGLTVIKNIRCAGMIYGDLTGNVTGNVSGTAGGVAWDNVTSKPSVVVNNGSTYNINISGRLSGSVQSGSVVSDVFLVSAYTTTGGTHKESIYGSGYDDIAIGLGSATFPILFRIVGLDAWGSYRGTGYCSPSLSQWVLASNGSIVIRVNITGNSGVEYKARYTVRYEFICIFV